MTFIIPIFMLLLKNIVIQNEYMILVKQSQILVMFLQQGGIILLSTMKVKIIALDTDTTM